jgi:uncharacterized delta-60 repeat protein
MLFKHYKNILLIGIILLMPMIGWAQQAGDLDRSFNYGRGADYQFNYGYGASGTVNSTAVQANGKIIIGGDFTSYNGNSRNFIARLNADGSLDATFNPGTGANDLVYTTALQADGKIIIGGRFTSYNGTSRNRIARLNADGSLDATFNPGSGADNTVWTIAVQENGEIIIGGDFNLYDGAFISRIARLNANGSLDSSFDPEGGPSHTIQTVAAQGDGKIIIGGHFTSYNGTSRNRIARLNDDGSLDATFNPGTGANGIVWTTAVQEDGKIIIGGAFTSYNGTSRSNIARLMADGSLNATFNPGTGANGTIIITALQPDGKIIIGGSFTSYNGTTISRIARLNTDGSLNSTFNPGTVANNGVTATAVQADGKIIIGGSFSFNGISTNYLVRLNADGSLDATLNPGTSTGANNTVQTTAMQPDGKIIIGGNFTSYNGTTISRIARLNTDGSLDATLNPGTGANAIIYTSALQPGEKIIIGGNFTSYNGTSRNFIARLNADGSLDATFNPGTGANGIVQTSALQPDGKIIIGGQFTSYNGTTRNRIARLNADGSLDETFNPAGTGANNAVQTTVVQADGKIIIGGSFTSYNGTTRSRIARLNADGSLDATFNPGTGANNIVRTIAVQADGKIVIGGAFTSYNSTPRTRIARINADGSLDVTFNPGIGANGTIIITALQPDGKVIIGGQFTSYNGTTRNRIARLNADGSLDTFLNPETGTSDGVLTTTVQPDGKILIAGSFTGYNDLSTPYITRIQGCSTPATPTISGNATFCTGGSTTLTSSSATGNVWSTGATSQSITVSNAGSYTVRVIDGACTSVASTATVVTLNAIPTTPTISSSNGTSICSNETTTLSAGTASGFVWSNGATTATITVGAGTYSVRTLNIESCTSSVSGEVVITQQVCNQNFTGVGNLNSNGNWSTGATPASNTDVIIDGSLTVSINYSLRNITINPNDTIKIPTGITLTVTGNLANEGVITGLGTLLMAGANNQSIGGGRITNLTVANGQTVVLSAATSISGTLTLGANSTFDLNNNALTFVSTATQTASLAAVPSGASLTAASNFTVQRWLNPNNTRRASNATGNYYLLGPVVQNQTVGLWNGVSPYGPETFNQATQSGSRFYFFNSATNAWRKPTSLSQALPAGTGVQVWFGTQAFFLGGRTTWSASGTPVVGNFNMPLTSGFTGFNLVSNPYPSTIDWDSPNWTKTGVANAIYIYDWVNQRYRTYVNGIQTNGASRYLPTAQGFFVNATTTSPVLTAREDIKVSNQVAMQRAERNVSGLIRLSISNNGVEDEMVIANRPEATTAYETMYDAQKMMNPTTNIFVSGAVNQSIASMNMNNINAIPFVLQANATGSVTLITTEISGMEGYTFNIFNEQTGELLPYTGTETYTFNVAANQLYRLQLRVGSVTGIETFKATVFEVFPNPASDKVTVRTNGTGTLEIVNNLGQVLITQPAIGTNEINVSELAMGVYTVKFNGVSQKLVVR